MKRILTGVGMMFLSLVMQGQDYSFSQFYALPSMRNPALTGVFTGNVRLQSVYRSQWQNVTVPYRTSALSAELKTPSEDFTVGFQITHDVAGDSKLTRVQAFPSVAYHRYLNDASMLTVGFAGGYATSQFDASKLRWDDQFVNGQYSASNPTGQVITRSGANYWDFGFGASLLNQFSDYGRWYVGASAYHIHQPYTDFAKTKDSKLRPRYTANLGVTSVLSEMTEFSMYADYMQQGGHKQMMIGAYVNQDLVPYAEEERVTLALGASYRWNDAVIPMLRLTRYEWNLGISYDVNISKLKSASQYRGGFELTLGFRGFVGGRNRDVERVQCFERL